MTRRRWSISLLTFAQLAVLLGPAATPVAAEIAPPWCGTPQPEGVTDVQSLDPNSFPHIPWYAMGCTLERIAAESNGRMAYQVTGQSALGRDMYVAVFNALDTPQQRRDFQTWQQIRKIALTDPARAQEILARAGDDVKVPVMISSGIHGGESEGVDAMFMIAERLATTPYGTDPEVDAILDHVILIWNVVQNPDGRIATPATRGNGNGFDLNRDWLTQSQPETLNTAAVIREWLPVDLLDLHGYVTPTLIEATTKPHNPSIEYDLWLKWNQDRIDANEAAMNAVGLAVTRPLNDWCSDGSIPDPGELCPDGHPPGPAVAESWDDWGPFYTPMYAQHIGLNGSTVEMCNQQDEDCLTDPSSPAPRGRLGARLAQYTVSWSTLLFNLEHRNEVLHDELEIYRRGVENAPRPGCPPEFSTDCVWMHEYGQAYVIPMGEGQRSDVEANRLVGWMLMNQIEVEELKQDYTWNGSTFQKGSYIAWLAQARRGLLDTAIGIGVDISDEINILYAPPGAWSHGWLWGADVVPVPRDAVFAPQTNRVLGPSHLLGGVEPGPAERYALKLNSATSVRTLNALLDGGLTAELAQASFETASGEVFPAGSILFSGDTQTKVALDSVGKAEDLWFARVNEVPATEPIDRKPRIFVLAGAVNQDIWSLRDLGFDPDFMSVAQLNSAAADPLPGYDLIWNTGAYPSAANATARARLQAFFAAGGGYIGALANGANFLNTGALVSGLTTATRGGNGRSGIINWINTGLPGSPITGAFPATDTAIMDPPTWFTAVPASLSVDARFPSDPDEILAAGLWQMDAQSASAPGSALIAHGTTTSGAARVTIFAMNPLYRADPEREWSMVGSAAYWADQ